MGWMNILAQTTITATETSSEVVPIDFMYEQITSLSWLQAVLAVSFGVVYLMYGWRIFKVLTVICFGLLGLYGGMAVGRHFGNILLGGVIGLAALALLSVPLMKWAVSILGAIAGGVLTAGLWYGCNLPEQYIWAGALVGIVGGGMISFIVFKIAVMLFSSLGGAAIMVTGFLSLLHHYEPTTGFVHDFVHNYSWFLPVSLLIPTIIGIALQNKLIKRSKDWDI